MAEDFGTPVAPPPEIPMDEPRAKNNNTVLIIVIVVLVLLCCCCLVLAGVIWAAWTYGDQFLYYSLNTPLGALLA